MGFFQVAPFYRLLSGIVWFGGLLAIALFSYRGEYSKIFAFKIINISIAFLAIRILVQQLYFRTDRPSGFLDEPSYAGLLLLGWAAAIMGKMIYEHNNPQKIQKTDILILCLTLSAGLLTKSMHLITFILSLGIILYSVGLSRSLLWQARLLSIPLATISYIYLDLNHVMDRLVLSENITNISLLSWLRGFDQAEQAALISPVLGYGLGSTGFIPFFSKYSENLAEVGLEGLNITDAYSALFRLVIEIGFFGVLIILFLMLMQAKGIRLSIKQKNIDYEKVVSKTLAIFGLALLIGVLIKEPTYSRSYVFLAVFLLATNWFGGYNFKSYKRGVA